LPCSFRKLRLHSVAARKNRASFRRGNHCLDVALRYPLPVFTCWLKADGPLFRRPKRAALACGRPLADMWRRLSVNSPAEPAIHLLHALVLYRWTRAVGVGAGILVTTDIADGRVGC